MFRQASVPGFGTTARLWPQRMTAKIFARQGAPLSTRATAVSSAAVFGYLAAAYALIYYVMPGRAGPNLNLYVAQPLLWSGLAVLAFALWRRLPDCPPVSRHLAGLALFAGLFQVSALVFAGVLFGFGHSPYASGALHLVENAFYLATLLAGMEMSRAYLLHTWGRVSPLGGFAAVALLYAAVGLAPATYELLTGTNRTFETAGALVLPAISVSIMATFLVSVGGPLPAFAYRVVLVAFTWFSPLLPQLDWTMIAFIGTVTPVLAMLIVRDAWVAQNETENEKTEEKRGVSPLYMLAAVAVVGLIWLNVGLLGFRPALVSGVSMRPSLRVGDIVLTKEVDPGSLEVGDVIRYRRQQGSVLHRIRAIERTGSGLVFVTQGDNNNAADPPVLPQQIEGKMVANVPKVGWAPIGVQKVLRGLQ